MRKVYVAVGSTRRPKLNAVWEALSVFGPALDPDAQFDVVGVELSVAIDRFSGAVGIRDAQGAWGVLSSNMITRQDAFRVAVVSAFAPFYNSKMYLGAAAAG